MSGPGPSTADWLTWKTQVDALVATLQAQVGTLQGQNTTLIAALTTIEAIAQRGSSKSFHPKPCLPDIDKLATQIQWDTFLPELEVKLQVDCEALTGEKWPLASDDDFDDIALSETAHKILFFYAYGRFESKIKVMVLPLLQTAKLPGKSYRYTNLTEHFDRVWETPNKKKVARDKLLNFTMGTDSFAPALTRFERLLHEAEATNQR